jgi:hypothetical protein
VGVVGLGLAVVGVLVCWRDGSSPVLSVERGRFARRGALLLAALGLFLALGGFNPLYFILVKLVPGFGLFRAPARWLALYAVGVAGLAGIGLEGMVAVVAGRPAGVEARTASPVTRWLVQRWWAGLVLAAAVLVGLVLLGQLPGGDLDFGELAGPTSSAGDRVEPDLSPPLSLWSVAGWSVAACLFGAVLYFYAIRTPFRSAPEGGARDTQYAPRLRQSVPRLMAVLVTIELLGASLFLPFNRATAPGALTSLRPSVAHLLAEADAAVTGPPARFLSISDIFFDPGDKPEIEIALKPQLSADALYDYVIATKQKEVLIPNLPLYYRLPTMDGYDGGVLPLRHYVTLERLYMPGERAAIAERPVGVDGRLRENLEAVPDGRWLSLCNVRFVVTDKVGDAWFDGVFYDLQMGANLRAGDEATVGHVPALPATALGVVYRADGAPEGTSLAEVEVVFADEQRVVLSLLADGAEDGDRVARLVWGQVGTPSAISVRGVWEAGEVTMRGLSLIDERTGVFQSLVLSDKGRYRLVHSGDVKIYENLDVLPRAFFVPRATVVPDDEAALVAMRDPEFDPATTIVLAGSTSPRHESRVTNPTPLRPYGGDYSHESRATNHAKTELLLYEPERVVADVVAPSDGWLLVGDAWYPGWEARVDGQLVPVERADILFRAVAVPAGEHRVEWVYRSSSFRLGAAVSAGALALLIVFSSFARAANRSSR